MVKKINWECEDCESKFVWWFSRPAETEEEKQHLKNYGFEFEDYSDNPRTKDEWSKAELYDVTEPYEPNLVSESDDSGYCLKCKNKIKDLFE